MYTVHRTALLTVANMTYDGMCPSFELYFFLFRRAKEMQETAAKAAELTNMAEGKHHIGDFLPPDELAKFMEKVGNDEVLSFFFFLITVEQICTYVLKTVLWMLKDL